MRTSWIRSPSIDDYLRRAIRDIQFGAIPDWFEVLSDFEKQPDTVL